MRRPNQLIEMFPKAHLVGAQFGVVLVDGVEVATFRSDHSYAGRPASNGSELRDRSRNKTYCAAISPSMPCCWQPALTNSADALKSHVVDYVGGLTDLSHHMIRAIGDPEQRFEEDHLRMLRAVRFAARLGFEIEPATMAAIRKLHHRIARVSPERIRDELVRILTEGGCAPRLRAAGCFRIARRCPP